MLLLDQVLNKKLGKPFIKLVPESALPMLSPTEVKAQLSDKFKQIHSKLDCENASEKLIKEDQEECASTTIQSRNNFQGIVKSCGVNTVSSKVGSPVSSLLRKQSIRNENEGQRNQRQNLPPRNQMKSQCSTQVYTSLPNAHEILRQQYSAQKPTSNDQFTQDSKQTSQSRIKSILKQPNYAYNGGNSERQGSRKSSQGKQKHKFQPSSSHSAKKPQQSQSNFQTTKIRFEEQSNKKSDFDDLERQIESDVHSLKIQYDLPESQQNLTSTLSPSSMSKSHKTLSPKMKKFQETMTTGSEVTSMDQLSLQNQVIKLKTDNEIMNITLRHLQDELNQKSETIRKQQQELAQLRQTVLDLQTENQRYKTQSQWNSTQNSNQVNTILSQINKGDFSKENNDLKGYSSPPIPYEKPISPMKDQEYQKDVRLFENLTNQPNSLSSSDYLIKVPFSGHSSNRQELKPHHLKSVTSNQPSQLSTAHFRKPSIESSSKYNTQLQSIQQLDKESYLSSPSSSKFETASQILKRYQGSFTHSSQERKVNEKPQKGNYSKPEKVQRENVKQTFNMTQDGGLGIIESEKQLQDFDEEFNKIFNNS